MDVVMPGKTGIEAIPDVLHDAPEAKVLILSMQDDPRYVREAFAAGASGYVLKEAVDTDVVAAIRDVAAGGRYVQPALGARMLAADAEERKRAEQDPLSDRERDVLRLLALGHTNQEIAAQLYLSVRTAETHRAHIMQKLRITTRAELVRYALEQGTARRGARALARAPRRGRRSSPERARRPAARIDSTPRPLRTISQEISELEFHISPAASSSRPQTAVGTSAHQVEQPLRERRIVDVSRCGLSTASSTSGIDAVAPAANLVPEEPQASRPAGCRPRPRRRRRARRRCRRGRAPARSRSSPSGTSTRSAEW